MRKVKLYLKTDNELTDKRKEAQVCRYDRAARLAREWTGGGMVGIVENTLEAWEIEAAGLAMHGVPQFYRVRIADEYPPNS